MGVVDGWIYFRVEHGKLPQESAISYAALPVGVTLYKVTDVVISDLTVQGFALDGVNLHDAIGPCILVGVNARANGRSGVAVVGASVVDLQSCQLSDNGQCQLLVDGYSDCHLGRCEFLGTAAVPWEVNDTSKLFLDGNLMRPPNEKRHSSRSGGLLFSSDFSFDFVQRGGNLPAIEEVNRPLPPRQ